MRKRIPAALIKRAEKAIKDRGLQKLRPVMMVPEMLLVDEWGELAAKMQAILKDNVKRDTAPAYGELPQLKLLPSR